MLAIVSARKKEKKKGLKQKTGKRIELIKFLQQLFLMHAATGIGGLAG